LPAFVPVTVSTSFVMGFILVLEPDADFDLPLLFAMPNTISLH
jgi:hypothetical protein